MTCAAVYTRKSTDNADGVERQAAIAKDFIRSKGWTVGPVFSDNSVSGADFDRPGLNALLRAIEAAPRAFDRVVTMDGSRLGREQAETLALQLKITGAGVRVFYYQDGAELVLNTPTQKLVASVGNFAAEDYRFQVQEKTSAALRQKFLEGHAVGARTYGYKNVPQGVGLGKHGADKHTHVVRAIAEGEAAVVRRIFTMAADGIGDRRIAKVLQDDRVPAPIRTWAKDIIRRMLANEVYIGVATYESKGEVLRKDLPELRIVSDDLWQRVQERKGLTRRAYARDEAGHLLSKPESGLTARYVLSGFAKCHECGGAMNVLSGKSKGDRDRLYCTRHLSRPGECSNGRGAPYRELEAEVLLALRVLLGERPEVVEAILAERDEARRAAEATDIDRRPDALVEAARLEKEIRNLVGLAAAGEAGPDILSAIADRRAQVEALQATPARGPFDRADLNVRLRRLHAITRLLDPANPEQARAALRKLGVQAVIVRPDFAPPRLLTDPLGESTVIGSERATEVGSGWSFEGLADLQHLLQDDASRVSSEPTGSP